MGTRSDIIVHMSDDTWARIYCHWDGYPDHHGPILTEHYADQKQAEALIMLGDLSRLAKSPQRPKGHSYDKPVDGYCVAYGRDRKEKGTEATRGETLASVWPEEDTWTEFTYVWTDGCWWVGDPGEKAAALMNLSDVVADKKAPRVRSAVVTNADLTALNPNFGIF